MGFSLLLNYDKMYRLFVDIITGRVQAENLRFNRTYVTVSELAQQLYCEYKLELAYREGKITTEEKILGTQIHEEVFKGKSASVEEVIQQLVERESLLFTMPVAAVYREVPIVGIPDALLAEKGLVTAVIELKTTGKWLKKVFPCEYFQANLYAYILDKWNLLSKDCRVVIVKILRKDVDLILNRQNVLNSIISKIKKILDLSYSEYFIAYKRKNLSIHCYSYDKVTVEKCLDWAIGYWRCVRPISVPLAKSRCVRCEYRHICEYYRSESNSNAQLDSKVREKYLTQQMD